MHTRYFQAATLVALGLSQSLAPVAAEEVNWVGNDGAWEDGATNWSTGSAPSALDFARILYVGHVSSTANGNTALEVLNFSTLAVSGGSLDVIGTLDTAGAVGLNGGAAMTLGRLDVQDIGSFAGSGSTTTLAVVQGIFNSGVFTAENGVTVSAESIDNFTTMTAALGASVTANSMINHASALLTVTDAGTDFTINGAITNDGSIGVSANGTLGSDSIDNQGVISIESGGTVQVETLVNRAELTATGPSSTLGVSDILTNHANVSVSASASGELADIVNHGTMAFTAATATGHAIDNRENATLTLEDGADVQLLETSKNRGAVALDATSILATGAYQQLAGGTTVDGGTLAASLPFGIDITGGSLSGHGLLDGNLIVRELGTLTPGSSADQTGMFTVTGDVTLGGLLSLQLAGLSDFDWLDIGGSMTLGGTLDVDLIDTFDLVAGDFFDIMRADSILGSFGSVLLPLLNGGLEFQLSRGADYVRLAVVETPVPLPAALWLFASALAACGLRARRR